MLKKDLMTGDIVVLKSSNIAVVIRNESEDYLLFQNSGWESLDDYSEDMVYLYEDDAIVRVYRSEFSGISFADYEDEEPIYERAIDTEIDNNNAAGIDETINTDRNKSSDSIRIIAQQFYGNRTETTIRRDEVDYFLKGILSPELFIKKDLNVDRRIVKIPGTDNIVIVYDQNQENEYLNVDFPKMYTEYLDRYGEELRMRIACEIPEIGFKIHIRCFACRIDEDGELQSIENGDGTFVTKYFTYE